MKDNSIIVDNFSDAIRSYLNSYSYEKSRDLAHVNRSRSAISNIFQAVGSPHWRQCKLIQTFMSLSDRRHTHIYIIIKTER